MSHEGSSTILQLSSHSVSKTAKNDGVRGELGSYPTVYSNCIACS